VGSDTGIIDLDIPELINFRFLKEVGVELTERCAPKLLTQLASLHVLYVVRIRYQTLEEKLLILHFLPLFSGLSTTKLAASSQTTILLPAQLR
jgi:hypothetical protein